MRTDAMNGTRGTGLLAAAVLAAVLLGGAAGCEQRVVGVRNTWISSDPERFNVQPARPEPQSDKGPLASLGDALFGWMRSDAPEPERRGTYVPVDPHAGPVTETRSPNAQ